MGILNDWIDNKLADIANELPTLVQQDPRSFACGYNVGYKQALLDLENFIDDLGFCDKGIEKFYRSKWDFE